MAQPTLNQVHVDAVLTNISVAYIQKQAHFIAGQVFPVVPVDKKSDLYYVYTKADWFRDEAKQRAPGTPSAGSGYGTSTDNYSCNVWALHKDVDDQTRANADAPLDPDRDATQFVTQRLMLRREKQWASDYFAASVWGTDVTGVAASPSAGQFVQWNDYGSSDPVSDVETGKQTILGNTGFLPNTLVLSYPVFRYLKHHPDIVDRFKYTTAENVTAQLMARFFEVDRVLVTMAVENTAVEGETASYSFVQGKHAALFYVSPTPSLMQPSAGYTFAWKGVSTGLGKAIGVRKFRMEHLKSDRIEGEIAFDNKVVATDLGYFFASAVA